jgi:hypothetical protein
MDPEDVRKATNLAVTVNVVFIMVAMIVVPFALFGSEWIFSRAGFKGWCVVSFIWVWISMIICVIWPVLESWSTIKRISGGIIRESFAEKGKKEEPVRSAV